MSEPTLREKTTMSEPGHDPESLMVILIYSEIPSFLFSSAFYKSLNAGNIHDEISVPEVCYKADDTKNDQILFEQTNFGVVAAAEQALGPCSTVLDKLRSVFDESWSVPILMRGIRSGRGDLVAFLLDIHEGSAQDLSGDHINAAVKTGNIAVINMLRVHGFTITPAAAVAAVRGGHLKCLKFLHTTECQFPPDIVIQCLEHMNSTSRPDCLKWLVAAGFAVSSSAVEMAIGRNLLNVVKYLLEKCAVPLHANYMMRAAFNHVGSLPMIKYLHSMKCPWGSLGGVDVAEHLIRAYNLESLQFSLENGCLFNLSTLIYASHWVGNEVIMRYLLKKNGELPVPFCLTKVLKAAVKSGNLEMVRLIVSVELA